MAFTKVVGPGIHTLAQLRTHNIHSAGIITATKFVGEMESGGGESTFQNVTVQGNLTVQGDQTTLNTTLRNVELLRVSAASTLPAGIITQTGSGDILNLYDNTTEVFSVEDGGKVKIGMGALGTNSSDYDAAANNLIVGTGSGDEGITILSGQSVGHHGSIFFADGTGATNSKRGQIRYEQNNERMKFFTGGSEKLTILLNGHVGIGNTLPGRPLTVRAADPRIRLEDSNTGGHVEIYTDNSHNLYFSADSSSSSGSSQFFFNVNGTEKVRIQEDGDIIYGPGDHIIGGDPALIEGLGSHHNNNMSTITYGINDGGNTCGMRVENFDDGTYNAQRVKFLTAKGGYSMATVRMTIDELGNVGIGSTIPASVKLDVAGKGRFSDDLIILNGKMLTLLNDANSANIKIDCDGGARLNVKSYDKSVIQAQENWGIRFFQGNETERLAIEPTGGIVVGTGGTIYMPEYVKHSGNTTTYFGFSGDNTFKIYTNDAQRLQINNTGVFQFNHSSVGGYYNFQGPTSDNNWGGYLKLNSYNNTTVKAEIRASTNGMWFQYGDTIRLIIKQTGKVGIGTDNPSFFTHIQADGITNDVLKITANGAGQMVNIRNHSNTASIVRFANYLGNAFWDAQYNTDNSFSLDYTDSTKFKIDTSGQITNTGIATSFVTTTFAANFAKLDLRGTNIANSNHYILSYGEGHSENQDFHMVNTVGHLVFRTGASGQTQRVRINSAGEMSIGGQHASYAYDPNSYGNPSLLIAGDDNADILTLMNDDPSPNNGDYASLGFRIAGQSTGSYAKAAIIAERNGGYNAIDLLFCCGTDADATRTTTSHEKVRIKSNGRVGVGSDDPQHPLDVAGNIRSYAQTPSLYLQTTANIAESAVIRFGDTGSFQRGAIQYDFGGISHLRFKMGGYGNAVERMTLTGAGCLNIGGDYSQQLDRVSIIAGNGYEAMGIGGTTKGIRFGWDGDRTAYDDLRMYRVDYSNAGTFGIAGNNPTFILTPTSAPGSGIVQETVWLKSTGRGSGNNEMNLMVDGDVVIGGSGKENGVAVSGYPGSRQHGLGVSKLTIQPDDRTTAFNAADGDTWFDIFIKQKGGATNNAAGIAFQVANDNYHKNAGTGIAAVKNGTNSDYGSDLVFITRPQSAVAQERMRITSGGNVETASSLHVKSGELKVRSESSAMYYQVISGIKTFSDSDTIVGLAYIGHSHSLSVQYMIVENNNTALGGAHGRFDVFTTYGNGTIYNHTFRRNAMNGGRITGDPYFEYCNGTCGSHGNNYVLRAKVAYSGTDDNFTIRYVIKGLSIGNMYV